MDETVFNQATPDPAAPIHAFCPQCGTKLADNTVFCPQCGTKQIADPVPQQAPVYSEPAPNAPVVSNTGMPVASIVFMGIALYALLMECFLRSGFIFSNVLTLMGFAVILISFTLHKKNLYFIGGFGWLILLYLYLEPLIQNSDHLLDALLEYFSITYWYNIMSVLSLLLVALGFFLARKTAGIPLRVIGSVFGLFWETIFFFYSLSNLFHPEAKHVFFLLLALIQGLFLFLSVVAVRPNRT